MTKSELTGAAYLKLTDMYPTMDAATWWEDVDLLVAPAVNFVMIGDYFYTRRDEDEEKILQPMFVKTFTNVPVTYDSLREKKKFRLPKRPLKLPKNRAIPFVGTHLGEHFVEIEQGGGAMQGYYSGFKKCVTSYELEGMDGFFENLSPLITEVMIKQMVSVSDIGDDEEIDLPDGGEFQVISLIVDFFTGKIPLPKDYYNTGKEPQVVQ